ncbi:MAG: arginine repressor [Thermoanaerobacterales bacterium]|nr:arginine repressor [Bacillota bacterium]MDI6906780.1 arginine repressor [Thermoanaerobacterales bacterium]
MRRQRQILEIIRQQPIGTQLELAEALRRAGFKVTQATVSRDIRELGLVKSSAGPVARYLAPGEEPPAPSDDRLRRFFRDYVTDVDHNESLVVVKTLPGAAHGVAEAIDQARLPGILGSVAGDNTIFIAARTREQVRRMVRTLTGFLDGKRKG